MNRKTIEKFGEKGIIEFDTNNYYFYCYDNGTLFLETKNYNEAVKAMKKRINKNHKNKPVLCRVIFKTQDSIFIEPAKITSFFPGAPNHYLSSSLMVSYLEERAIKYCTSREKINFRDNKIIKETEDNVKICDEIVKLKGKINELFDKLTYFRISVDSFSVDDADTPITDIKFIIDCGYYRQFKFDYEDTLKLISDKEIHKLVKHYKEDVFN